MDTANPKIAERTTDRRVIRYRTITRLRWLAIIGQLIVTFFVRVVLGFELPVGPVIAVTAVAVWMNIYTIVTTKAADQIPADALMRHLFFDTAQISTILYLTGGIQNPFSVWLILPGTLSAASLDQRRTSYVVCFVVLALTIIAAFHKPLPSAMPEGYDRLWVYDLGTWMAMMLGVGFTSVYAHQVAADQERLSAALEATENVLSREERLTALGGLAAVAAHELGTPLATIQVTAKEMEGDLDEGPLKEDAQLILSQTQRCQTILRRLSNAGDNPDAMHNLLSLDDLLREAAKPFFDEQKMVEITLDPTSESSLPSNLKRMPEVVYSLRTLIENAYKYSDSYVRISARWTEHHVTIDIEDDGPGFPADVLSRLGEPFPKIDPKRTERKQGLGLGFFIAKTLLERTGAAINVGNGKRLSGAWVELSWPLANLRSDPTSSVKPTREEFSS